MEPSAQGRQALSTFCICLTDVPDEVKPDQLCAQLQGRKSSKITSPNGDSYKWLVWLVPPMAAQYFIQQSTYLLDIDGKTRIPVKIESCIPCDLPSEWVDEFMSQGGLNYAYGGPQFMGQYYPFPQGPQPGYQYPGFPQGPHQGYPQGPDQGQQDGVSNAEGNTQPEETGPGGQAMGFGPGFPPQWGYYQQPWGYPSNQGAPPPYNSKGDRFPREGAYVGPPGGGYVSDVVSQAQDEFLEKIERKRKKEEKRQGEEMNDHDEEPKGTNMIKVSKLPKGTTKDSLTYFFENRKRSGGGETEDVDFEESDMTAIITFEDPDAVRRILQKRPILFQDKQIEVEEFYPGGRDREHQNIDDEDEEDDNQPLCTIEIKGFKSSSSDDTIQFYFENPRRSGGGDIDDFTRTSDVIYITFEDESIAKSVAERNHKVDGAELSVKVYVPPPPQQMYSDKIFIQGLNSSTTKDCLSNFLEAKSASFPTDIVYGEEDGTALVTFEETVDFEKLQNACKKRALEGSYLSVSKVPVTNCLKVHGFSDGTSQDTLMFYFENSRRSGGGELEKIELNKEDGTCLVFFKDHKVLDEVCKRKHKVDDQQLVLHVYHECLGNVSDDEDDSAGSSVGGRKFKQPESFSLNEADKRKVEFLKHSKSVKDAVEKQLKSCHAAVQWPKSKTDFMVIDCLLTAEIKDCKTLAKTWKKTATDSLNQFFEALIVEENLVLQEAWDLVMEGLKGITIQHPDGIAVISEPENCKIILVGYKHIVKNVSKQVNDIIAKVGEDLDRKKQQMKEKVQAKYHQARILILTHFPDKIKKKFPGLNVKIELKSKEIRFEGLSSEISNAKLEMYELFDKITSSKVDQFSKEKLEFCDTAKVREYIVAKLRKGNILAVWEIEPQRNINMYALSDKDAVNAAHIFQQSIVESPIDLSPESVYLLQSDIWSATKKKVEDVEPGLVKIVEDPDKKKIIICTTSVNVGNCREMVEDFLLNNTVTEQVLSLPSGEMRLIQQEHSRDIEQIARELKDDQVKITLDHLRIIIKGTTQGLNRAKQKIDTIIQKIVKNPTH
ncbi:hypothetical protein KUTeg_005177 [Tegillarca granosa]|uniref:RRM domain-containing protein n=1 Tax=Tegillarca granosa TaxID=220873 RepID=A0ABQ9FJ03_TEGGR|nr:hypothetical protein KUTeg_005177 [Tegillarca granosa]